MHVGVCHPRRVTDNTYLDYVPPQVVASALSPATLKEPSRQLDESVRCEIAHHPM